MPCAHERAHLLELGRASPARSTSPITSLRTEPWPMKLAKFGVMRMAATLSRNGASGIGDPPSGPSISVVTPWRT